MDDGELVIDGRQGFNASLVWCMTKLDPKAKFLEGDMLEEVAAPFLIVVRDALSNRNLLNETINEP
jgi:hypothetical protein